MNNYTGEISRLKISTPLPRNSFEQGVINCNGANVVVIFLLVEVDFWVGGGRLVIYDWIANEINPDQVVRSVGIFEGGHISFKSWINLITLGIDKNAWRTQFTKQVFPELRYPLHINCDSRWEILNLLLLWFN